MEKENIQQKPTPNLYELDAEVEQQVEGMRRAYPPSLAQLLRTIDRAAEISTRKYIEENIERSQ